MMSTTNIMASVESHNSRQVASTRKEMMKVELLKKKEMAKQKKMKSIESKKEKAHAKIQKKKEKAHAKIQKKAGQVEWKKKNEPMMKASRQEKMRQYNKASYIRNKAHRQEKKRKYNKESYIKNASIRRAQQVKNYRKRKGTWNQFSHLGKKIYSGPSSIEYKDKVGSSLFVVNLNTINDDSSPEEVRNGLMEDVKNNDGTDSIEKLMEDIREKYIRANIVGDNPNKQEANICVICDELIIGLEPVKYLTKEQILSNKSRISVESFESHYVVELNEKVKGQYQVEEEDLHGILLSPRGVKKDPVTKAYSYCCCSTCYSSMVSGCKEEKQNPPKFAIANGFVIGHIPRIHMGFYDSNHNYIDLPKPTFDPDEYLDDLICAAISPVRPYGYVHAYQGGSQKSITGHFSFFSVDQSHVGGVLNKYKSAGNSERQPSTNIFVVLCGRMTPNQKQIIRKKSQMNTNVFLCLLNWFVRESGHSGFDGVVPPEDCSDMIAFLRDEDTENNTDESADNDLECRIEGKTYYFSDASHRPDPSTSVFDATEQFVKSMLDSSNPTMLMYGGSYLKSHELHLEDVFPIQFPFGLGGPNPGEKRKVAVSEEACLRHYMRLSLKQFMRSDFILVCYHLLCRMSSYTTGLIKCKSNYRGAPLAEKISQLTSREVENAANDLTMAQQQQENNGTSNNSNCASAFLKSVTTSCKVLGHTTEAAKDARRKTYSMTEFFGPHSVFFTVTPCDECTYRVRLYANEGKPIDLPLCDCDETECISDFTIRSKVRTTYPGACSLFYQAAIQSVYELLGWDPIKNCSKRRGIFGDCIAIVRADEEQGRGTLHAHILVWIKNFAQISSKLFHPDEEMRNNARECLREFVDNNFTSDYGYDDSVQVTCKECGFSGSISDVLCESSLQDLRDGRNKHLCCELKGEILECKQCSHRLSTVELNDIVEQFYREQYSSPPSDEFVCSSENPPLSKYRRDVLTYRMPLDNLSPDAGNFYNNKMMRHHIANRRMNEHDFNHRRSCFKYSDECRARFPERACSECEFILDDEDPTKGTVWRGLHRDNMESFPYTVKGKRSAGSQYLNTFNDTAFQILACNNNVQMGSARSLFYVVHYATKSTQKEDRGVDFEKIGHQVMRRIRKEEIRLAEKDEMETLESDNDDDTNYCFREGLSRFLLGMSVHLSQDVVSSTMAHLLVCQRGSRFTFSHDFKDLLVGQMLNHLNGEDPGYFVLKRKNRVDNEDPILWPDYSINDYLFRPRLLNRMCFYQFGIQYEKGYFTFAQMKVLDDSNLPSLDGMTNCHHFEEGHPGRKYCYLKKCKNPFVPKVSSPKNMICDLEFLELDVEHDMEHSEPSPSALQMREDYAKCALVLFYPFRDTELFVLSESDNCLWDKFQRVMSEEVSDNEDPGFWPDGKYILQNMQDRIQSTKTKLAADDLESKTENRGLKATNQNDCADRMEYSNSDGESEAESIGSLDDNEMYQFYNDEENMDCCNLDDLKKGKKMRKADIISTRLSTKGQSVFECDLPLSQNDVEMERDNGDSSTERSIPMNSSNYEDEFSTLLALVSGSTVGSSRHYIQEYEDSLDCINDNSHFNEELQSNEMDFCIDQLRDLGVMSNFNVSSIPTMRGVARRMHEDKGIELDPIQYVAYKVVCSSFLLNLINEGWEKRMNSMSSTFTDDEGNCGKKDTISQKLRDLGAKEQLLMFITGPAGSGKSTSLEVAQHFCFEFCRTIGEQWDKSTFLFTAMTGSAASLFGGVTLHSAAFLNTNFKNITGPMMRKWEHVKMLIVDEISMASDPTMTKLNDVLNKVRRHITPTSSKITPSMVFGGYSIIFSGDFHQIPPVKVHPSKYLYAGTSIWENAINVAIFLRNSHRFKDDPEYGRMLLRIWHGELSEDDIKMINTRLVGLNGVELPDVNSDSDIAYSCPTNLERNLIHTELFQQHIRDFPSVSSEELPPEHTVVIEANISKAPKKRRFNEKTRNNNNNNNSNNNTETPSYIPVNNLIRHRIYTRCGDSDVSFGTKHIDPAIKWYTGAHCMVNDNDNISEGRANGTMCRAVSTKRKINELKWKNYDGKKVYTINVCDTNYIRCEHFPPTIEQRKLQKRILELNETIPTAASASEVCTEIGNLKKKLDRISASRQFKLYPKEYTCTVDKNLLTMDDGLFRGSGRLPGVAKRKCRVKIQQYPINLNDATTGHKLQGMTKNTLIVRDWSFQPGWLYTNLSRVRTLTGLFINKQLNLNAKKRETAVSLSRDLINFEYRMRSKIPQEILNMDTD